MVRVVRRLAGHRSRWGPQRRRNPRPRHPTNLIRHPQSTQVERVRNIRKIEWRRGHLHHQLEATGATKVGTRRVLVPTAMTESRTLGYYGTGAGSALLLQDVEGIGGAGDAEASLLG